MGSFFPRIHGRRQTPTSDFKVADFGEFVPAVSLRFPASCYRLDDVMMAYLAGDAITRCLALVTRPGQPVQRSPRSSGICLGNGPLRCCNLRPSNNCVCNVANASSWLWTSTTWFWKIFSPSWSYSSPHLRYYHYDHYACLQKIVFLNNRVDQEVDSGKY